MWSVLLVEDEVFVRESVRRLFPGRSSASWLSANPATGPKRWN